MINMPSSESNMHLGDYFLLGKQWIHVRYLMESKSARSEAIKMHQESLKNRGRQI